MAADQRHRLPPPGEPLLAEGAGFVFVAAGLQGALLGQLDGLHRGGWAAVVGLEHRREFAAAGVIPASATSDPALAATYRL
ncbi:MAG: hypothetical protein ACR2KO_15990 [Geodermatophilaceae bacterium]